MVLPPQKLYIETIRRIREIGQQVARALQITGPFNIQFLAKANEIKVIECNLRASRSFPFVSKVARTNFVDLAVAAMLGEPVRNRKTTLDLNYVGVKAPQFSFTRLKGADPALGVEMASTGEVACLGDDVNEAFLKALISAGYTLPRRNILLSLGGESAKVRFLEPARTLRDLGFRLFATDKTAKFLHGQGIPCTLLHKVHERRSPNIRDYIARKRIDFVIAIQDAARKAEFDSAYRLRRMAVDFSIPLLTNLQVADLFVQALAAKPVEELKVKAWDEYE
jgi:carbamoyl-phosphate synthase large subunit